MVLEYEEIMEFHKQEQDRQGMSFILHQFQLKLTNLPQFLMRKVL